MNRGSAAPTRPDPSRHRASMRPRFMNRGSGAGHIGVGWVGDRFNEAPIHESGKWRMGEQLGCQPSASMRPRFMNRGSVGSLATIPDSCDSRFNEAPIHESGKSPNGATSAGRFSRFNEAPIHESGKCSRATSRPTPIPSRFNEAPIHESGKFNRGQLHADFMQGFNEAPIHESGKYRPLHRLASHGRRFNEAPIHESGKSTPAMRRVPNEEASMRPRFMNRGSSIHTASRKAGPHCFNEAPIHESGKWRALRGAALLAIARQ